MVNKARPRSGAQKLPKSLRSRRLSFIAADPERLGRFLAATGIGPADIRAAARRAAASSPACSTISPATRRGWSPLRRESGNRPEPMSCCARDALAGRSWERDTP